MLTNELPRIHDAAAALASRFVLLVLTKSFYGQEDPLLEPRLLKELSGILNWSLAGYRRLAKRGYFIQPESAKESIEQLEILGSPVTAFVREKCELGPGQDFIVEVNDLYAAWRMWCESSGLKPTIKSVFGRDLSAAFPSIRKTRPTKEAAADEEKKRVQKYENIKLVYGRDEGSGHSAS